MARIPSPLHGKTVPKRVSKPTVTAEAAATVAESAVAPPAPRRARVGKVAQAAKKAAPAAKKTAPARKDAGSSAEAKAVPAKKSKVGSGAKAKTPAKATTAGAGAPAAAPAKPAKAHKAKLVRDSFTIPKDEYAVLAALKSRALGLGQHARKSELLRAGIRALAGMDDGAFLKAVAAVPTLKTGRPSKK